MASHKYLSLKTLYHKKNLYPMLSEKEKTHCIKCKFFKKSSVPTLGSIKNYCGVPYNQGDIGSCTANAFCMAYQIETVVKEHNRVFLSRLDFYYNERLAEDPSKNPQDLKDSGGDVIDGLYIAKTRGICLESSWPYDVNKVEVCPPQTCTDEAGSYKISSYQRIPIDTHTNKNIRNCILNKTGVLTAIGVYSSFESNSVASSGLVPLPKCINFEDSNDPKDPFQGGHEVLIVAYNDNKKLYTCINSWGEDWGDKGFFYIPYDYIHNPKLTYELVTISK